MEFIGSVDSTSYNISKSFWQNTPYSNHRGCEASRQLQLTGNTWLTIDFHDTAWPDKTILPGYSMNNIPYGIPKHIIFKDICIGAVNLTAYINSELYTDYNIIYINTIDMISIDTAVEHITHCIFNEADYSKYAMPCSTNATELYNVIYGAIIGAFARITALYDSDKNIIKITHCQCNNTWLTSTYHVNASISRFELCDIHIN
jgi:hypothetical protein